MQSRVLCLGAGENLDFSSRGAELMKHAISSDVLGAGENEDFSRGDAELTKHAIWSDVLGTR